MTGGHLHEIPEHDEEHEYWHHEHSDHSHEHGEHSTLHIPI
jgi:hypothetical protein